MASSKSSREQESAKARVLRVSVGLAFLACVATAVLLSPFLMDVIASWVPFAPAGVLAMNIFLMTAGTLIGTVAAPIVIFPALMIAYGFGALIVAGIKRAIGLGSSGADESSEDLPKPSKSQRKAYDSFDRPKGKPVLSGHENHKRRKKRKKTKNDEGSSEELEMDHTPRSSNSIH